MAARPNTLISYNGSILAGAPPSEPPLEQKLKPEALRLVSVNGEPIPTQAIREEAQRHPAPKGEPRQAIDKAIRALVIRALLLQEAGRLGVVAEPKELEPGRFETDGESRIRAVLEMAVKVDKPSDDAVQAEWNKDPTRFRSPPLWEVSHILVACDPRDASATKLAHGRAVDITRRAMADPDRFARLAQAESDCGSKANSGMLGQLSPGDSVPEFERALHKLHAGDITAEPVLTRYGWHVIKMDACAKGDVLPFESARAKLSDAMEKAAWAKAARKFTEALVASAVIEGAEIQPLKPGRVDHDRED